MSHKRRAFGGATLIYGFELWITVGWALFELLRSHPIGTAGWVAIILWSLIPAIFVVIDWYALSRKTNVR